MMVHSFYLTPNPTNTQLRLWFLQGLRDLSVGFYQGFGPEAEH